MTIDQSLLWFMKDFENQKGRTWFRYTDIKYLPKIILPVGYSVRPARAQENGDMTKEDREVYVMLQKHDLDPRTVPRRLLVTKAEGVFFAEYNGKPVGCDVVIIISEKLAGLHNTVVLRSHRRKGLCKAMLVARLRFCIERKFEWIHIVPAKVTFNSFKRMIPCMSEDIATG